jgi:hypothetical protein
MLTNAPRDTFIKTYATVDTVSKHSRARDRQGVRIYKHSPDRVALQIWGKRANTPMYGTAFLSKEALTELRDAATELLNYL